MTFLAKLAALKAAKAQAKPIVAAVEADEVVEQHAGTALHQSETNPFKAKLLAASNPTPPVEAPIEANPFLAKLAAIKAAKASASPPLAVVDTDVTVIEESEPASRDLVYYNNDGHIVFVQEDGPDIILNESQMEAVNLASKGKSFVLTGAAGTGKTTAQAGVVWALHNSGAFATHDFKHIGTAPSIALVAFTKVAVRNMQRALRKNPLISQYEQHCMTIHSLLEYEPETYTEFDLETGEEKEKWNFRPQRHAANPLTLTHLVIEEASMVDLLLWQNLYNALPANIQIILLGDINQLRPVFGDSILIYALDLLPVIELTEVYRQALESPIIANAHNILNGRSIASCGDGTFNVAEGRSQIKVGQETMAQAMAANVKVLTQHGKFDPDKDMILSPWNKHPMGTKNLNNHIATWLGIERKAHVQQVRAGRNTWWLAVGDRVLVDKRLGTITDIVANHKYHGTPTKGGTYSRFGIPLIGTYQIDSTMGGLAEVYTEDDLLAELADHSDFSLADIEEDGDSGSRAASHLVTVVFEDDDLKTENVLASSGQFADDVFQFGYCLTVHKAQGSEWDRVLLMLHWDHATTLTREFLYTAVTRAAKEFTVFGKMHLIDQAIARASLKGKTLADKIAYFNAGASKKQDVPLLDKIRV